MSLDGSARAALLTVFGDVVRPTGDPAWLGAISELMATLGIAPATTRQALRRLTTQAITSAERVGRQSRYGLTAAGAARLDEAAARIYADSRPAWDGRWRLLSATFEEQHRSARDALRRELRWLGYGSIGTSSYACPWDRGAPLRTALHKHGVHGSVDTFTADHDGDDAALAARAYDLPALAALHDSFIKRFGGWAGEDLAAGEPLAQLAGRVELVHEWRRTLFLDPGLPAELTPVGWRGDDAAALFLGLHATLSPGADAAWRTLTATHAAAAHTT